MLVEKMKKEISVVYPNQTWEIKVKNMNPSQVLAIYYSFLKQGKFDADKVKRSKGPKYEQLAFDFFDCGYWMGVDLARGDDFTQKSDAE